MSVEAFPTMSAKELRQRAVRNVSRMGHCAPTVMQTMLDASDIDAVWLVLLTAGLPGGIANTRRECGGLTAPLIFLGVRHGREQTADGIPVAVEQGHDLLRRFTSTCGTTQCSAILGNARLPLPCIRVIRAAPAMCAQCIAASGPSAIPTDARQAYRELCTHWREREFHCSDAVLAELEPAAPPSELADAATAFMGGTLLTGMTCSALVAGVMALGLALGEIEDSRRRVVRMLATMAVGGDALADDLNAFNRVMSLGHDLARWFEGEFGSTQCAELTGCDFATTEGVRAYIEHDGTAECARVAQGVAARVSEMLASAGPPAGGG